MPDLDVQIRTYLDATSEPLTVDDVLYVPVGDTPVRPITHRATRRRPWRGWLVAGAAAAVLFVVLGLLPFLLRGGSTEPAGTTIPTPTTTLAPSNIEPESADNPVPTTAPATTLTEALTTPPPSPFDWIGVDLGPPADGRWFLSQDNDGYVISSGTSGLLFSEDGRTWTTDAISPELAGYTSFRSQGDWAVAGNGPEQQSSSNARDLLRSDGSRWEKVDLPGSDGSTRPELPVTFRGTSLVVDEVEGIWVAPPGESFAYVDAPWVWPQGGVDPDQDLSIHTAADGGFVATLALYDIHPNDRDKEEGTFDGEVLVWMEIWTSPDGFIWRNHGVPAFLGSGEIDYGLYVLTHSDDYDGLLYARTIQYGTRIADYVSSDAIDWRLIDQNPGEPGMLSFDNATCWVQATQFGYACPAYSSDDEEGTLRFLVSTDGQSWQELDQPLDTESDWASAGGVGDLVFVSYYDDLSVLWISRPDL